MQWFLDLFTVFSVSQTMIILSIVIAAGLFLGNIKIGGISIGITGVLFVGIAIGHFGFTIDPHTLEFLRDFGLILFVYTVGMQVGPGFFSSFRREGLKLNILAALIVILGLIITFLISKFGGVDINVAVGLFSGATTNTPSLGAAQQALISIHGNASEIVKTPALGYAIAYPFGILGVILSMLFLKNIFKINIDAEEAQFIDLSKKETPNLENINIKVTNAAICDLPVEKLDCLKDQETVISRVMRDGEVFVALNNTHLKINDVIHLVGSRAHLLELEKIIGIKVDVDISALTSPLGKKRILVTKNEIIGKGLLDLNLYEKFRAVITRVRRGEVEFAGASNHKLNFGDLVTVVGEKEALKNVADYLGNSIKSFNHPQIIPVFVGIALGVILGSIPIKFSGLPYAFKIGLAGGPLLVAILFSWLGKIGPLIWHMPTSANYVLREIGISIFLACVGIRAGGMFFTTLFQGDGFYWMLLAALITVIPVILVGIIARAILQKNFMTVCGLLSGSMTDPPALAFANQIAKSDTPAIAYATVYPLTMMMRVIGVQLLIIFFG